MSSDLVQHVKAAIAALAVPSETQKANEWLVDFEKSSAAWQVSDLLIREPAGSACRFFGAKFFYSKIQKQYIQLDSASINGLTQTLVQHILNLSQEQRIELNVCRYLCLALAVLALQVNQPGIIGQILQWLNPIIATSPAVLLELLQALPEETYNRQVDVSGPTRDLFIRQLSDSSGDVLAFLSTLWGTASAEVRPKILLCAEKWIGITRIPASSLLAQPVFSHILQSLSGPESSFEAAADAVIAIVQVYQCREPAVLQTVLPAVLSLRPMWSSVVAKLQQEAHSSGDWCRDDLDEELLNAARTITRIFTELAESCVDLFVLSAHAESMSLGQSEILAQLLECAKFQFDGSVARIPLKFFYELAMVAKSGRYNSYDENGSASGGSSSDGGGLYSSDGDSAHSNGASTTMLSHAALKVKYAPVFSYLLEVALGHLRLTDAELLGSSALLEDSIDSRLEWKETVLDCAAVLGGDATMELLCGRLQQEASATTIGGKVDWRAVETVLFCVTAISSFLSREESKLVPQLISFVTALPEQLLRLHVTAVELLGRLAFWVESNPSYLPVILAKLLRDLQVSATALVAAKAVMAIFRNCARLPGIPVHDLHNMLLAMRASGSLSLEAETFLLESIAVVVARFATAESENSFRAVMLPIASALSDQINSSASGAPPSNAAVVPNITRMTVVFRFYHTDGDGVVQFFLELVPLFQRLLQANASESVCEKVSSCYKHALRSCGRKFVPHLPMFSAHLAEQFGRTPFAAFLYAGSVCVSSFATADKGAHVPLLYQMVWAMSGTFFGQLSSLSQFEQRPDVVEEYFFLMAKALQYCPAGFVEATQESRTVIQAAITGLSLRHREAQKGILLFFERVVQLASSWPETSQLNAQVRSTIIHFGPGLVSALLSLLSGEMPAYAIDESNGCISDVMWTLRRRFEQEFQAWVSHGLQFVSADAQTIAAKSGLVEAVLSSPSQRDFSRVLDRFERSCRRCVQ